MIKKILTALFIVCIASTSYGASTNTTYMNLEKPGYGDADWHTPTNANWDLMDVFGLQHQRGGSHRDITCDTFTIAGKFTADGATVFSKDVTTIPHVSKTITPDGTWIFLDVNFSSITIDSTPSIGNGEAGQILYLTVQTIDDPLVEGDTVLQLRDKDTLAGSNLDLNQTRRSISPGTVLTMFFDGSNWQEISYIAKTLI